MGVTRLYNNGISSITTSGGAINIAITSSENGVCSYGVHPLIGYSAILGTTVGPYRRSLSSVQIVIPRDRVPSICSALSRKGVTIYTSGTIFSRGGVGATGAIIQCNRGDLTPRVAKCVSNSKGNISKVRGYCGSVLLSCSKALGTEYNTTTSKGLLRNTRVAFLGSKCVSTNKIRLAISESVRGLYRSTLKGFSVSDNTIIILSDTASRVETVTDAPSFSQGTPRGDLGSSSSPFLGETVAPCSMNSIFGTIITYTTLRGKVPADCDVIYGNGCSLGKRVSFNYFGGAKRNGVGVCSTVTRSYGPCFVDLTLGANGRGVYTVNRGLKLNRGVRLTSN